MSALPGDTHPAQHAEGAKFQGRNVLARQFGTCMHCKCDLTSFLVNLSDGRRWVSVETFGLANVEHRCTRAS